MPGVDIKSSEYSATDADVVEILDLRRGFGWEPQISLQESLVCFYPWIEEQACWKLKITILKPQKEADLFG